MRTVLVVCAALAVASCSDTSGPPTQPLTGVGFRAEYDSGWTDTVRTVAGATVYQLSSRGHLSGAGIPEAGAIGISVEVLPFSVLVASGAPNPASLSPAALMAGVVSTPSGATDIATASGLHDVPLGGDSATTRGYRYVIDGTHNVQLDVVDRHRTTVYVIELDTAPALQSQGEVDLTALLRSWTWTA